MDQLWFLITPNVTRTAELSHLVNWINPCYSYLHLVKYSLSFRSWPNKLGDLQNYENMNPIKVKIKRNYSILVYQQLKNLYNNEMSPSQKQIYF